MTEVATRDTASILESVVIGGDLNKLTPGQRVDYYQRVCASLSLNPLTKPFQYLSLQGRLTLYASRDCTDQLRKLHGVKVRITSRERADDLYIVSAMAELPDGRTDESIGAVTIGSLKGDALANALMKAETKAKRRVTLSICGLGMMDETEIETVPNAQPVTISEPPQVEAPKPTNGTSKPPAFAQVAGRPEGRGPFYCQDCGDVIRARLNVKLKDGSLKSFQPLEIAQGTFDKYGVQLCWDHSNVDGVARAKAKLAEAASPFPGVQSADDEPESEPEATTSDPQFVGRVPIEA
jgi:hypothetical protein